MSKTLALFASAALAVGGFTFMVHAADQAPNAPAADKNAAGDKNATAANATADDARKAGDATAAKPAPDADDIRKTVATATESAVTKGGFDDLVERFVDHDRDRLHDFANKNKFDDLDGRVDQFLKDWKAKYNQDFKLASDRNNILGDAFARISQGEIGEARTASGKEQASDQPKVKGGTAEDLQKSGAAKTDANSNKTFGGDTNKEAGRDIATMTIPASHGMPELSIPLIHEAPDTWKIDLPDNIDGQKLHDNLLKHLTMADDDKANWPNDVNEGYRAVTHHVMAALFEGSSNIKGQQPAQPGAGSSDNAGGIK